MASKVLISELFEVSHTPMQGNNPNDKTQTILFRLKQFCCLLEPITQSIFNRFRQIWYQSLRFRFFFLASYHLLIYLASLSSYVFSNTLTFFRTPCVQNFQTETTINTYPYPDTVNNSDSLALLYKCDTIACLSNCVIPRDVQLTLDALYKTADPYHCQTALKCT